MYFQSELIYYINDATWTIYQLMESIRWVIDGRFAGLRHPKAKGETETETKREKEIKKLSIVNISIAL